MEHFIPLRHLLSIKFLFIMIIFAFLLINENEFMKTNWMRTSSQLIFNLFERLIRWRYAIIINNSIAETEELKPKTHKWNLSRPIQINRGNGISRKRKSHKRRRECTLVALLLQYFLPLILVIDLLIEHSSYN